MISLKDKQYKEIEIVGIESLGIQPTFDIGVKNHHHYLTKSNVVTHNSSIFANIDSGGLEPVFGQEFIRTVIVNHLSPEMASFTPKWFEGEWFETDVFKFTKEGDEELLRGVFEGVVYKIDKNRGLTKEVLCQDYGVRVMKERGEWDSKADWAVTALDLSVEDHLQDLIGFARWIDSSVSKCMDIETTMVIIDDKVVYLDELPLGGQSDIFIPFTGTTLNHLNESVDIKSIYKNGTTDTVKITFDDGSSIISTKNHKLFIEGKWVEAQNVTINMMVNVS
jgi:hypothetical protein